MYRSISGLTARRRVMALVVAIFGAGTAMFVAAPAHADPPGAHPPLGNTVVFNADQPGDHESIECTVEAPPAYVLSGVVYASATVNCVHEDGTDAEVPYMSLTVTLANPSVN